MFDLDRFTLHDMTELGTVLRRLGDDAKSMQQVADRLVRFLYENLGDAEGARCCALVRFFKTHAYRDLTPGLQGFADDMLKGPPDPGTRCLTLLASAGDEPGWNSPESSAGHRAIPLASREIVSSTPMISSLLQQLGVEVEALLNADPELMVEAEPSSFNVFYVPDAKGSSSIPAQDDFVKAFGIESVLGFGGMLPNRDIFAVILFSHTPIPRETAELFRTLALNVKLAMLRFDEAVFARG